jgi:hypothetical protein
VTRGALDASAEIGDDIMARPVRKILKEVPLAEVKDESEDDSLEYRLENDPRFLKRIAKARASLRAGRGVPLEDLE